MSIKIHYSEIESIAHIGLSKTGSTYLQNHIFPQLFDTYYSTDENFKWPKNLDYIREINRFWYEDLYLNEMILKDSIREKNYEKKINQKYQQYKKQVDLFRVGHSNLTTPLLLSSEGLCGLSLKTCDTSMKLLKQSGVTKIIFVIRRQTDFAQSLWKQFLLTEDRFKKYIPFEVLFGGETNEGIFELDWNIYINSILSNFNEKNVCVVPYELFVESPHKFIKCLVDFLGVTIDKKINIKNVITNPSKKNVIYKSLKLDHSNFMIKYPMVRKLLRSFLINNKNYLPDCFFEMKSITVKKDIIDIIKQRYKAKNVLLESRFNLSLSQYKYF